MTPSEIIEVIAKSRGTILCLGLKDTPPLEMFGVTTKLMTRSNVLIIPTERSFFSKEIKCYVKGMEWRIVNCVISLPVNSLLIVSSISQINPYTITGYLKMLCEEFNLQAVSLVDSFPFHTKEGLHIIEDVRTFCQGKNLTFNVGLLYGVNKYGSTDISTEDEAVQQEIIFLKKEKNIDCIKIDQAITIKNVLGFCVHNSESLKRAIELFQEECERTMQNIELTSEILYAMLQIPLNSSLIEYVNFVKNKLTDLHELFPVVNYFNEIFFEEFRSAISSKFKSKRDSENNKVSKWCVDTLIYSIIIWIKSSNIAKKNEK